MGILKDAHDDPVTPSTLTPSTLISAGRNPTLPSLKDATYKDLSLQARLAIKRAVCRVEVIKTGSNQTVKYDVFERLNTGGAELTPQEVRDCIFRDIDPDFIEVVDKLARFGPFCDNLHLSEHQEKTLFDRGLVLRYFTMKNAYREFEHDVEPFITDYVRAVLEQERAFDVPEEQTLFEKTFGLIADAMNDDSWRPMRNGRHTGPFSVHVFDTVSVGVALNVERIRQSCAAALRSRIEEFKQAKDFLDNTGADADIRSCLLRRMDFACEFFSR